MLRVNEMGRNPARVTDQTGHGLPDRLTHAERGARCDTRNRQDRAIEVTYRKRRATLAIAAIPMMFAATELRADGEFFQFDTGPDTTTAVVSVERGPLAFGLVYSDYTGPEDLNLSVTYKFNLGTPVTFRAGPTLQHEGLDTLKGGLRLVAEHYQPTSFGSVFLLGEFSTIDRSYFALAAFGLRNPKVTFELSHLGDDDGFRDTVAALAFGIPNTKASLRLGHKIETDETFVGISVNTF